MTDTTRADSDQHLSRPWRRDSALLEGSALLQLMSETAGISGVAVCPCPYPYPCFSLRSWQVCCWAAALHARAPPPVSVASVVAAGRAFVRPAAAAVAASAGFAVASLHPHSVAEFSAAADTASAGPSGIPDPVFVAAVESVPGASVRVADSRC